MILLASKNFCYSAKEIFLLPPLSLQLFRLWLCFSLRLRRFQDIAHLARIPYTENRHCNELGRSIPETAKQKHSRDTKLFVELDLCHSKLLAYPIHPLSIHICY